jgi:DnaJ-class molecular chaperone
LGGGRGDAYVRLNVRVPKKLNKSQKEAVETLKGLGL